MGAAVLKFNGDVSDTAGIITAVGVIAAANLIVIPQANGLQVSIYEQGS